MLALSLLVFTGFHMVQGYLMSNLLRYFGACIGTLETLRIVLLSLVGKYVPGKVWILTMRSTFFAERGVPVRIVLASAGLENVYIITTAVVLFLLTAPPPYPGLEAVQRICGILLMIALLVSPGALVRAANRVIVLTGREPVREGISRRRSAYYAFMFSLTWLVLGAGIWVLSAGLGAGIPLGRIPALSGIYSFSVVVGFVAFFAPGGIGVREGLFVYGLKDFLTGPEALFLALAARLFTSLSEIIALAIVLSAHRLRANRPTSP
ncbi:MAG: hypothetical protein ABIK65_05750 [Candidatus Eisenbacteria bacterium]